MHSLVFHAAQGVRCELHLVGRNVDNTVLNSSLADQSIDFDRLLLPNSMSSIDSLGRQWF